MSINKKIPGVIGCFTLLMLSACGGGGGGTSTPDPVVITNTAPVISGTPAQTALAGANYQFQPTAQDADGDNLSFSASNLPSWLSLDASTGLLSGIPWDSTTTRYENIQLAVTDGNASANLPAFEITVTPTRAMTFTGIATDNPLVNARVVFTIGGIDYETTTDSLGNYNLSALLPKISQPSATPVIAQVFGAGAQDGAHLVALLPSYEALLALPNANVDMSALAELRITHVTTARYLMALHLNNGNVPATTEQLHSLYGMLDVEELERLQAAIKLLIDNPNYDLGGADLITLLSSGNMGPEAAFKQWLSSQSLTDSNGDYLPQVVSDLNAANAATQSDANQALAFTVDDVVGDLFTYPQPHPDVPPAYGQFWRIVADGSAWVSSKSVDASVDNNESNNATWSINDGKLVVLGNTSTRTRLHPIIKNGYDAEALASSANIYLDFAQHLIDSRGSGFEIISIDKRLVKAEFEIKSRDSAGLWIKLTTTHEHRLNIEQSANLNWPNTAVSDEFTETQLLKLTNTSNFDVISWNNQLAAGQSWALPFEAPLVIDENGTIARCTYTEHLTFNAGGTAFARIQNKNYNWSIEGNTLKLTDTDSTLLYNILWQKGEWFTVKMSATHADNPVVLIGNLAIRDGNQDETFQTELQIEEPDYWQTGFILFDINNMNSDLSVNYDGIFGWSFRDDLFLKATSLASDRLECIDASKDCISQGPSNRTWAVEGGVVTHTYHQGDNYTKRPWEVMSHNGNYTTVLEHFDRYDANTQINYMILAPRLNPVFRSTYPEVLWSNTPK